MLRASAQHTGRPFDLAGLAHLERDTLVDSGGPLIEFVNELIQRTNSVAAARDRLAAVVADRGVVRAAAVAGNFEMMNRLVDATGVPVGPGLRSIADDLQLSTAIDVT